ncbi:MAG: hypothetical protein M1129_04080 [Candidatus Thermoplasmatota archaeon]|jgi:hypothetical protein|nr:hypothetical protein [Candidatus Thermoplasmatota archaeon]MCL5955031.1 hypothetical protein [Candidatus Thermoplasmatota archaeon]
MYALSGNGEFYLKDPGEVAIIHRKCGEEADYKIVHDHFSHMICKVSCYNCYKGQVGTMLQIIDILSASEERLMMGDEDYVPEIVERLENGSITQEQFDKLTVWIKAVPIDEVQKRMDVGEYFAIKDW